MTGQWSVGSSEVISIDVTEHRRPLKAQHLVNASQPQTLTQSTSNVIWHYTPVPRARPLRIRPTPPLSVCLCTMRGLS